MIRFRNPTAVAAIAFALCSWTAGCRKRPPPTAPIPSQRAMVVQPPEAPGLTEPRPGKASKRTVRRGEVLQLHGKLGAIHWEGEVEGKKVARDGEVLDVKRAESDGPTFVFASDVVESDVPTAEWVCDRLGNPVLIGMPCTRGLRRTLLSGGRMLAFIPGVEPACPVAVFRGVEVGRVDVVGLSDVQVVTMSGQEVVLAWSRWVRGSDWTGAELVVLLTQPSLRRIGQVPLEEADARQPDEVTNRMGALHLEPDGVRFEGKRRVYARATGVEKTAVVFSESWRVTQDGRLVGPPGN